MKLFYSEHRKVKKMRELFKHVRKGMTASGTIQFVITPDDDNDLEYRPRRIITDSVGEITLMDKLGTVVTYSAFVGRQIDFMATRVMATGTTAGLRIVGHC
jgi:hypothetical protein